ncbi:MAG: aldolase/citrate lyase family protein [Rhodospirillales bacterium]
MDSIQLKARLSEKQPVIGTWSHIPNIQVVEIIGASGFDFIIFDMEHGPHSYTEMPGLYCAAESSGLVPFIRVPAMESSSVLRSLDSGAKGVVFPHVDGAAKAEACLQSLRYGNTPSSRGIATLTRSSMFDYEHEKEHIASQNDKIVSVLLLEDKGGLDELDRICDLEGLDVVFVGIYDLSQSLGFKGGLDDPGFKKVFADSVKRIRDKGAAVGCYTPSPEGARSLVDMGITFITINVDGGMLRRAYQTAAQQIADIR